MLPACAGRSTRNPFEQRPPLHQLALGRRAIWACHCSHFASKTNNIKDSLDICRALLTQHVARHVASRITQKGPRSCEQSTEPEEAREGRLQATSLSTRPEPFSCLTAPELRPYQNVQSNARALDVRRTSACRLQSLLDYRIGKSVIGNAPGQHAACLSHLITLATQRATPAARPGRFAAASHATKPGHSPHHSASVDFSISPLCRRSPEIRWACAASQWPR